MSRSIVICDGELVADSEGFECTGEWISVDAGGIPGAFDISQLDPTIIAQAFGAGFMITTGFLVVCFGAAGVYNMIAKG